MGDRQHAERHEVQDGLLGLEFGSPEWCTSSYASTLYKNDEIGGFATSVFDGRYVLFAEDFPSRVFRFDAKSPMTYRDAGRSSQSPVFDVAHGIAVLCWESELANVTVHARALRVLAAFREGCMRR